MLKKIESQTTLPLAKQGHHRPAAVIVSRRVKRGRRLAEIYNTAGQASRSEELESTDKSIAIPLSAGRGSGKRSRNGCLAQTTGRSGRKPAALLRRHQGPHRRLFGSTARLRPLGQFASDTRNPANHRSGQLSNADEYGHPFTVASVDTTVCAGLNRSRPVFSSKKQAPAPFFIVCTAFLRKMSHFRLAWTFLLHRALCPL